MLPKFLQSEIFPYASVEIVRAPVLRVVCGWCGVVLTEGEAPTPVSHGMCPGCVATFAVPPAPPRFTVEPRGSCWSVLDREGTARRLPTTYETFTTETSARACAIALNGCVR